MKLARLGDFLDVQAGFAFKTQYFTSGAGMPLIRIRDLAKSQTEINYSGEYKNDFVVENGDYLIGMDGNFRCHRWGGGKSLLNQRVSRLRNFCGDIEPEFVFYGIQKKLQEIEDHTSFATVKHLSAKQIQNINIPLPPLPEQLRLADILSRAEGIVRLRREAERKAAELIPALFIDLFGDPATNPKGWPSRPVADFVDRFEGGKNLQAGSGNRSGYRILKVSAVTSGIYRETESKPAPDDYHPPESHIVRSGDMLFSRANTQELVGATVVVEKTDGTSLLPDKLWRFVWSEPVDQAYMHALFQSRHVRTELGKLSSGTSESMRNISQGKLFAFSLPVAPIDLQRSFGEQVAAIRAIQSQQAAATAKAQASFDALLAEAFGG